MTKFAAIEAGGTKFVCGIGSGPDDLTTTVIPTTTPAETIARCLEFFRASPEPLAALGIGSFGPVDLNPASATWGFITSTPKAGWQFTDLAGAFAKTLQIPVGFDTDVNAAALAEARWGAAKGLNNCVYLTVGTGIGGGAMINGKLLHGLVHPEMGHIRIPHDLATDPFPGVCPFHGDCLEGLASGTAMRGRWGDGVPHFPADHAAWKLEARYLALAVANFVFTLSPERVILGGGVMQQTQLFPLIHAELAQILNQYVQAPQLLEAMEQYVVPTGLHGNAGVLGALALAQEAAQ